MSRLPSTLPGMKTIAPPAKRKNAKSWTDAEIAFADRLLSLWNKRMGDMRKCFNVKRNRGIGVRFLRALQELPEAEQFTEADIDNALRAYRECRANEQLASWKSFQSFFRDGCDNVHAQLARTGRLRRRRSLVEATVTALTPPTPEVVDARRFIDESGWLAFAETAIKQDTTLRGTLARSIDGWERDAKKNRFSRESAALIVPKLRRRIDAIDHFEAVSGDAALEYWTRARTGFERYFSRPPNATDQADALRVFAIAVALFNVKKEIPK